VAELVHASLRDDPYLMQWFDYCLTDPIYYERLGYRFEAEHAHIVRNGLDPHDYYASTPDWVPGIYYSATASAAAGTNVGKTQSLGELVRWAINSFVSKDGANAQPPSETAAGTTGSNTPMDVGANGEATDE